MKLGGEDRYVAWPGAQLVGDRRDDGNHPARRHGSDGDYETDRIRLRNQVKVSLRLAVAIARKWIALRNKTPRWLSRV